jgi:hypothetical protein
VNTKVNRIKDNVIYAENMVDHTEVTIPADTIINALGSKKNILDTAEITASLTYVGDCAGERTADLASALRLGYHAGNAI